MSRKWKLSLILVIILLALAGCKQSIIIPPITPPEEPPAAEPPPGLSGPLLAALYDGSTVRLWDGVSAVDWKTGSAAQANGRRVAVNQVLYTLGADGAILESVNLPAPPVGVIKVNPVYTFQNITNAEAFALDWTPPATGGNYTRVWRDGLELGDWHANGFTHVRSFLAGNGDVVVIDNVVNGRFHDVSRPQLDCTHFIWVVEGGPAFYVPDFSYPSTLTVYDAAHPEGFTPAWSGPSTWPRVPWIEVGGVWYDGCGDRWDGATFWAQSTALTVFKSVPSLAWQAVHGYSWPQYAETPVVIPAYAQDGLIYFIETTTGTLWSYSPGTNVIGYVVAQLYAGDGKTLTGEAKAKTLKPELVDGALYYHDAGTLWKRDSASTVISAFSADQQMWVMR